MAPTTCLEVTADTVATRKARILELTGGFGADIVLECVGLPAAVTEGLALCRDGGKYLILGHYGDAGKIEFNPHDVTRKQMIVAGSWGFEPRHTHAGLQFLTRTRRDFRSSA